MHHAARQSLPWLSSDLWSSAGHPADDRPGARPRGAAIGGATIPLHGPDRRFACTFLGSDLPSAELEKLDRRTRPAVFLATALFNGRVNELLQQDREDDSGLSIRDRECLLWAAQGKTAWETATILSVSESSIKKHLAGAAAKLGARNRTQAVASAIARDLLWV